MIQISPILCSELVDQILHKRKILEESEEAQQVEIAMCAADPFYFLWNAQRYVKTFDAMERGPNKIKIFPYKEYLHYVLYQIHTDPGPIFIPKSRQIIITWLVCFYLWWHARFHPFELNFVQSKKEIDAANLVYNKDMLSARISFMEANLPGWMRQDVTPSFGVLNFPNGSKIWGVPQGADIIRSYTASIVFLDEAAFQQRASETYKAAKPSAGKIIAVSSAEPGWFGEMCGLQQSFKHRQGFLGDMQDKESSGESSGESGEASGESNE
jgi:hypothetical protein